MRFGRSNKARAEFMACCLGALLGAAAGGADAAESAGVRLKLETDVSGLMAFGRDDCEEEGDLFVRNAAIAFAAKPAGRHTLLALAEQPAARADARNSAPQQAAEPAAPAAPAPTWEIVTSDKTLNGALARWASTAGWQLVWDLPVDYAVATHSTIRGSFEEAVTIVAKSMAGAEIPLRAIFYNGNKVLRIVPKGAE